jgi:hypothetical protein
VTTFNATVDTCPINTGNWQPGSTILQIDANDPIDAALAICRRLQLVAGRHRIRLHDGGTERIFHPGTDHIGGSDV